LKIILGTVTPISGIYSASKVMEVQVSVFEISGMAQVPVLLGQYRGEVSQKNGNPSDKRLKLILPFSKIAKYPFI